MPTRAVILNADDLGLWPSVTDGILDAWAAGAISDSTAFANAPDLDAVLARAAAAGLPVGVHLNLTYGAPLCDPAEVPSLVDARGRFMKRTAWPAPPPAEQARREWSAQIARVGALTAISHLDSHHHVHAYPELLPVVAELAAAHRLPVRATDDASRRVLRAHGVPCPDAFSMAFYGEQATVETLIALAAAGEGILEIMTHPGHDDPALPSSYRADRACELAVLTDSRWREWREDMGVALVGFGAVG
jgi:predicted glycoside hydrolase/deacetylase ChbG (UPF0249 family)